MKETDTGEEGRDQEREMLEMIETIERWTEEVEGVVKVEAEAEIGGIAAMPEVVGRKESEVCRLAAGAQNAPT